MNIFNNAIEAHAQWKLTLKKHIDEGILQDIKEVGNCHVCELGRWIYGEGSRFNRLPSFEEMCVTHERFHRFAAEVVHYSNAGDKAKASSLLKPEGNFCQTSAQLVKALMECGKELADSVVKGAKSTGKVRDILKCKANNNVFSIEGTASVCDAIKMMVDHNIGCLAVYNNGNVAGIFTERGYLQNLVRRAVTTLEIPVSGMMDADTIYVDPEDSVEQCMVLMTSTHTRHLPVMQHGKLTGMISIGDVIKRVVSDDDYKVSQLEDYVHSHYGAEMSNV